MIRISPIYLNKANLSIRQNNNIKPINRTDATSFKGLRIKKGIVGVATALAVLSGLGICVQKNNINQTGTENITNTVQADNTVETEKNTVQSNGQIDEFKQGAKTGDCWLLSTLASLSNSNRGKKLIKDNITINNDSDTATVTFPGINYSSEISFQQIEDARNSGKYSFGDDDVILIELAVKDVFKKIINNKISNVPKEIYNSINDSTGILSGGHAQDMIYLYTGKLSYAELNKKFYSENQYLDGYKGRTGHDINHVFDLKEKNHENVVVTATMHSYSNFNIYHAYAIKSVDGDIVTLFNPVTNEELKYSRKEAEDSVVAVEYSVF